MVEEFETTAVKTGDFYGEFGISREKSYYWGKKPEDVVTLKMKVSEDQSEPDWNAQEYWGWLPTGKDKFDLIYPNYRVLHVCFPYGISAWEKDGVGKAYRLEITEINGERINDN